MPIAKMVVTTATRRTNGLDSMTYLPKGAAGAKIASLECRHRRKGSLLARKRLGKGLELFANDGELGRQMFGRLAGADFSVAVLDLYFVGVGGAGRGRIVGGEL